jgi:hypothetical protein
MPSYLLPCWIRGLARPVRSWSGEAPRPARSLVASSRLRVGAGAGLWADWSLEARVAARGVEVSTDCRGQRGGRAVRPTARAGLGATVRGCA